MRNYADFAAAVKQVNKDLFPKSQSKVRDMFDDFCRAKKVTAADCSVTHLVSFIQSIHSNVTLKEFQEFTDWIYDFRPKDNLRKKEIFVQSISETEAQLKSKDNEHENGYDKTLQSKKDYLTATKCDICGKDFIHSTHLLFHLTEMHDINPVRFIREAAEKYIGKTLLCSVCTRKVASPLIFGLHHDRHQVQGELIRCPRKCDKKYTSPFMYYYGDNCRGNAFRKDVKSNGDEAIKFALKEVNKVVGAGVLTLDPSEAEDELFTARIIMRKLTEKEIDEWCREKETSDKEDKSKSEQEKSDKKPSVGEENCEKNSTSKSRSDNVKKARKRTFSPSETTDECESQDKSGDVLSPKKKQKNPIENSNSQERKTSDKEDISNKKQNKSNKKLLVKEKSSKNIPTPKSKNDNVKNSNKRPFSENEKAEDKTGGGSSLQKKEENQNDQSDAKRRKKMAGNKRSPPSSLANAHNEKKSRIESNKTVDNINKTLNRKELVIKIPLLALKSKDSVNIDQKCRPCKVKLEDLAYRPEHGHKIRKQFKKLALSGQVSLSSKKLPCKVCDFLGPNVIELLKHIREVHLV